MINTYGRLNTAFGEQGDHVPNLNPEVFGKDKDDRVAGNPAAATPEGGKPNAEQHLVEIDDTVGEESEESDDTEIEESQDGAEVEAEVEPEVEAEVEVEADEEPEAPVEEDPSDDEV